MKRDIRAIKSRTDIEAPSLVKMSRADYDNIQRMNPSSLVSGLRGRFADPFAVKLAWENPQFESTDAMDRGTLAHLLILEPHLIESRVAIWDGGRRAGAEWDAFNDANADKIIIRRQDYEDVRAGAMVAAACPEVRRYIADCETELAALWNEGPLQFKGLMDAVSNSNALGIVNIPDIKTTQQIDEQTVENTIRKFRYREKMALYRRGVCAAREIDKEAVRVPLIFVKLEPPYGVNVTMLGSDGLDFVEKRLLNLIGEVERCIDSGVWNPLVIQSAFGMSSWEMHEEEQLQWEEMPSE